MQKTTPLKSGVTLFYGAWFDVYNIPEVISCRVVFYDWKDIIQAIFCREQEKEFKLENLSLVEKIMAV